MLFLNPKLAILKITILKFSESKKSDKLNLSQSILFPNLH